MFVGTMIITGQREDCCTKDKTKPSRYGFLAVCLSFYRLWLIFKQSSACDFCERVFFMKL